MTYSFMVLGLIAVLLSRSNKRWVCVLYVLGLLLEEAVYRVYVHYGILEGQWEMFYLCIALTDITILALMSHCYHRDYVLVYPLIFLMVCLNAIIPMQWVLMHSDYLHSIRIGTLEALNFALLLILFGRSDGILRILDKLHTGLLSHSFEPADDLLRMDLSKANSKKMEKGTCQPR